MVICTIITKNYLAHARVLAHLLEKHNPGARLYVLLADHVDGYFDPKHDPFTLIELQQIGDLSVLQEMCFYYTPFELANALKGYLHAYMYQKLPHQSWVYLDSDIMICGSLEPIMKKLAGCSILLSEHHRSPLPNKLVKDYEVILLKYGMFNGGFLGLSKTPETERFLDWFKQRLHSHAFFDLAEGLFVDQLWLNLVPLFFAEVSTLDIPGANVGYWNLHERVLKQTSGGAITVNDLPLLFFHFSHWNPNEPEKLSRYPKMIDEKQYPIISQLGKQYHQLLVEHGYEDARQLPYAFNQFANGKPITPEIRRLYYHQLMEQSAPTGNPFFNYDYFEQFLNEPFSGGGLTQTNKRNHLKQFGRKVKTYVGKLINR